MTTEKQSTPITADGLRGLGMTGHMLRHRIEIGAVAVDVWPDGLTMIDASDVGTAHDLETVARLIDVLRRMNGEGGRDDK